MSPYVLHTPSCDCWSRGDDCDNWIEVNDPESGLIGRVNLRGWTIERHQWFWLTYYRIKRWLGR